MRTAIFTLLAAALMALGLAPTAEAQRRNTRRTTASQPPKPVSAGEIKIPWAKSYRSALEESAARNVPVLVFFIEDGEEANERVVNGVLPDKRISELSERIVFVIASMADHGEVEVEVDGKTHKVCARYGHLSKSQRRRAEMEVRGKIFGTDPIKTPLYVLIGPDGHDIWRKEVDIDIGDTPSELVTAVMNDMKRLGPGMSRADYWQATSLLEESEDLIAKGELAVLMDELRPYATDSRSKCSIIKELQGKIVEVDQKGKEAVRRFEQILEAGNVVDAILDLEELVDSFEDMETGDLAEETLKRHEKTDAVKAKKSELRIERSALKQLDSALALEDRGRASSALKKYRSIVEKYGGTRAADVAKERVQALDG